MNIFIGSLPFKANEEAVREMFEVYGDVTSVRIISDKVTGRSKGYAFVEMSDDDQAKQAIEALNGAELMGREIAVNEAKPREERRPSEGGFRQRRDNDFRRNY